jgi:hypothetical protein
MPGNILQQMKRLQAGSTDPMLTRGIVRDQTYLNTFHRDMKRQAWRRRMHRVQALLQQWQQWPRWRKIQPAGHTLSVCIMTMNAADRIAPVLQYLRPIADELVIGIDSKTTDNTAAVCAPYADICFHIENPAATCNGGLAALVSRCTGDWVLRLDDDELVTPAFAQCVAALMQQQQYTHYKMPRLHLSALTPLTWIDDGYLSPDYQLRLFKNTPSQLHFPPPIGHVGIECEGKRGRLPSLPIIHLNLVVYNRQQREAKLRRYIDRLHGGWVHPVNESTLLFEDFRYRTRPYQHPDATWCQQLITISQHMATAANPLYAGQHAAVPLPVALGDAP